MSSDLSSSFNWMAFITFAVASILSLASLITAIAARHVGASSARIASLKELISGAFVSADVVEVNPMTDHASILHSVPGFPRQEDGVKPIKVNALRDEALKTVFLNDPSSDVLSRWSRESRMVDTGQSSLANRVAYKVAWDLQRMGTFALFGAMSVGSLLTLHCDQIIDDWLVCYNWVKTYRKSIKAGGVTQKRHSAPPASVRFHRRHGEWLALASLLWSERNWKYDIGCDRARMLRRLYEADGIDPDALFQKLTAEAWQQLSPALKWELISIGLITIQDWFRLFRHGVKEFVRHNARRKTPTPIQVRNGLKEED